ncbi:unnamed protein product [Ectocarpus sp. CCAP 1310/34]|nr:unnamed protein product [Ectocarpus sp. CCAP 1310/34]
MRSILCILLACVAGSQAFVMTPARAGLSTMSSLREGSFVCTLPSTASLTVAQGGGNVAVSRPRRTGRGELRMGKVSKFGIFSPAVVAAKIILGETRLNKIRGKGIALHSQVIQEYCRWVGAPPKVRGMLIRKAKGNGDDLGFLF